MRLTDWILRVRALLRPNRVERDLQDELSFHLEHETRKLIAEGLPAHEARQRAQARFGSTTVVADQCRDERGVAFIDNTLRDLQSALRAIVRDPLSAFTIIGTVSIGLGVVAVLFTILNSFLFRVDRVPDVDQFYAVEYPRIEDGVLPLHTRAEFDAMQRETSVFSEVYAAVPSVDVRVEGRVLSVTLVSGNFFDVMRVRAARGRALTPADDAKGGSQAVVVLSDRGWERRFNRDPGVIGRTVLVGDVPFEIIGVMPPGFRGLSVGAPDCWAPLEQLPQFRPGQRGREDSAGVDIVGRVKPEVAVAAARAQLVTWMANRTPATAGERAPTIDLVPRRGTVPQPMEALMVFTPLFIAFGLILLIGCANVANLLLARGVARQREVGIRLSIGASRPRIVRQLMTESLLLALAAAGGGYVVSRVALESLVYFTLRDMPVDLGDVNLIVPAADWRVALFLVAAAVVSTAFFALMPALQATRIDPVRTLRGELVKEGRPGRARSWLIGLQVFASALLLICAAIFLRSSVASAQYDPGLRTADTVLITIANEENRAAMARAIASEPAITRHAAVRPNMLDTLGAFAEINATRTAVRYKFVSGEYFDVMGIPIVQGRSFSATEQGDHPVVIVTESVARTLWPGGNALGETFQLDPDHPTDRRPDNARRPDDAPLPSRLVTVVGIARDIKGFRFNDMKGPGVFVPTDLAAPHTDVMARVTGDPGLTRQTLLDHLARMDPNMGIVTMRTVARLEGFLLNIAFWVAFVLGSLALLLTVSGLFSVLSYLVAQRTKEIGIRMALGASAITVVRLMLSQTARPVLYGLLAGAAIAASLAIVLLTTEFGAFIAPIVHVTDPLPYAGSLMVIVVACLGAAWLPATRAAKLDPMRTLRNE